MSIENNIAAPMICNCNCNDNNSTTGTNDLEQTYGFNTLYVSLRSGLKIGCLNVRGLLGKIDQIRSMLTKTKFDLMCLCETFLDSNADDNEISIAGYSVESRHLNRHGGGVLVYINDDINYNRMGQLSVYLSMLRTKMNRWLWV